jgi:hypothetical protein
VWSVDASFSENRTISIFGAEVVMLGSELTCLHGTKSQNNNVVIFTAMKTSELTRMGSIGLNKSTV